MHSLFYTHFINIGKDPRASHARGNCVGAVLLTPAWVCPSSRELYSVAHFSPKDSKMFSKAHLAVSRAHPAALGALSGSGLAGQSPQHCTGRELGLPYHCLHTRERKGERMAFIWAGHSQDAIATALSPLVFIPLESLLLWASPVSLFPHQLYCPGTIPLPGVQFPFLQSQPSPSVLLLLSWSAAACSP